MSHPVLDRAGILALVPHQGAMCLWDEVLAWDDTTVRLRAGNHRDPAHPLRGADGRLRALHLCEYGAQAMAVHGGLRARASPGPACWSRCATSNCTASASTTCVATSSARPACSSMANQAGNMGSGSSTQATCWPKAALR